MICMEMAATIWHVKPAGFVLLAEIANVKRGRENELQIKIFVGYFWGVGDYRDMFN